MRRSAVLLSIALIALSSAAVAVAATGTTTLTGTSEWSGLTFEHQESTTVIHGTFTGRLGKGTYEGTLNGGPWLAGCGPVCADVTGSITFSSNRGTFTGIVQPGSLLEALFGSGQDVRSFMLTLSVVDGTRAYSHADGKLLTLTYDSVFSHYFDPTLNQFVNEINDSGTLTGTLH